MFFATSSLQQRGLGVCVFLYSDSVKVQRLQSECSMFSIFFCYAVPHNLLKSIVLVFFLAVGMEIQRYRNVCCALTG
jgi:hypothetical protein